MKNFFLILFVYAISLFAQDVSEVKRELSNVIVYDICGDRNNIWVATYGNGVFHYSQKTKKWKNYSSKNNNLPQDFFYCIATNGQYVWAGSSDGLFIFDKRSKRWGKRKFAKGGQLSNWIRSIAYDKDLDAVWIGRFKYLTKLDVKRRRFTDYDLTVNGDAKTNTIKSIAIDGDSLVWFGTEAGLHKYIKSERFGAKGAVTFYSNNRNYFNGDGKTVSISDILFEQRNIWIGLDEFVTAKQYDYNIGGLYRYNRENEWLRFDTNDGLYGNGVWDIELIGNQIWASLYQFGEKSKEQFGRGVALIDRNTFEVTMLPSDKIPNTVFSIFNDGKKIWIGSNQGVYSINIYNQLANFK